MTGLGQYEMIAFIVVVTIAHTVSDVFLQPRILAQKKHLEWLALAAHVMMYFFFAWIFTIPFFIPAHELFIYWSVNGVLHFVIVAITSRGNHQAWQRALTFEPFTDERNRWTFYAIAWICVDQIAHMLLLVITAIIMFGVP